VIGPGQKILTCVGSGQPSLVLVWVGKFSPKITNFPIFSPSGQKIALGQVKKYRGQRQVDLLFTGGSKVYSGSFGSGPISLPKKCKCMSSGYGNKKIGLATAL